MVWQRDYREGGHNLKCIFLLYLISYNFTLSPEKQYPVLRRSFSIVLFLRGISELTFYYFSSEFPITFSLTLHASNTLLTLFIVGLIYPFRDLHLRDHFSLESSLFGYSNFLYLVQIFGPKGEVQMQKFYH